MLCVCCSRRTKNPKVLTGGSSGWLKDQASSYLQVFPRVTKVLCPDTLKPKPEFLVPRQEVLLGAKVRPEFLVPNEWSRNGEKTKQGPRVQGCSKGSKDFSRCFFFSITK